MGPNPVVEPTRDAKDEERTRPSASQKPITATWGEQATTECSHVPLDERSRMLPHVAPLAVSLAGQPRDMPAAPSRLSLANR